MTTEIDCSSNDNAEQMLSACAENVGSPSAVDELEYPKTPVDEFDESRIIKIVGGGTGDSGGDNASSSCPLKLSRMRMTLRRETCACSLASKSFPSPTSISLPVNISMIHS